MTSLGLIVGAALALTLLAGEIAQMLSDSPSGRLSPRLKAATWLLGGAFAVLVVAQLADYLA